MVLWNIVYGRKPYKTLMFSTFSSDVQLLYTAMKALVYTIFVLSSAFKTMYSVSYCTYRWLSICRHMQVHLCTATPILSWRKHWNQIGNALRLNCWGQLQYHRLITQSFCFVNHVAEEKWSDSNCASFLISPWKEMPGTKNVQIFWISGKKCTKNINIVSLYTPTLSFWSWIPVLFPKKKKKKFYRKLLTWIWISVPELTKSS